jgi:hypothetical protein
MKLNTDILYALEHTRHIVGGDDDSYCEILTVTSELPSRYPSLSELKDAIHAINAFKHDLWIERPRSAYDCTGQHFSTSINVIDRFVANGTLVYIFKHWISVDI